MLASENLAMVFVLYVVRIFNQLTIFKASQWQKPFVFQFNNIIRFYVFRLCRNTLPEVIDFSVGLQVMECFCTSALLQFVEVIRSFRYFTLTVRAFIKCYLVFPDGLV